MQCSVPAASMEQSIQMRAAPCANQQLGAFVDVQGRETAQWPAQFKMGDWTHLPLPHILSNLAVCLHKPVATTKRQVSGTLALLVRKTDSTQWRAVADSQDFQVATRTLGCGAMFRGSSATDVTP
jgi:hypothetical protein